MIAGCSNVQRVMEKLGVELSLSIRKWRIVVTMNLLLVCGFGDAVVAVVAAEIILTTCRINCLENSAHVSTSHGGDDIVVAYVNNDDAAVNHTTGLTFCFLLVLVFRMDC